MTPLTRTWLAFAAFGAGLIHLAIAAGSALPLAVPLAGLGAAELGWGVAILHLGRLIAPRTVVAISLMPLLGWGGSAAVMPGLGMPLAGLPLFPLAVASLFNLFIAVVVAIELRGVAALPEAAARTDQGGRYLIGLVAAGILVSGLTTPALAATEAGSHAVPHGTHHEPVPGRHTDGGHYH
jgi:hypothetical protein